ncbi:nicalin-1-like [Zingiber officinale]|uniref:nicalin-1-like n=1 Tax=Zingiber officinale TaxID=94328 RepID=UPI001C4B18E3|nr:nicalin-1-like [Zingiber officinale]
MAPNLILSKSESTDAGEVALTLTEFYCPRQRSWFGRKTSSLFSGRLARICRGGGGMVMSLTTYSILVLVLVLAVCVELGDAATAVDAYRLIQYDLDGAPYGSRLAALNHFAGVAPFASGVDLSRTAVILPLRDLNFTLLHEFITGKQQLGGLLFLLPQDTDNARKDTGPIRTILSKLEHLLIHANLPYPVYFAHEDDKINEVLPDVQRGDGTGQPASATTGGFKLVVSTSEPKKLSSPTITNIQGWLPGLKGDGTSQLPTIAVVASYDTFGAAPELSVGSDSNGSGVVVLLEIARLFSRLYSNPNTRGRYNLLFGLTSGGPYNYDGTMKWLRNFDQRIRESIEFAICLNSVGSWDNELWLHVSKPPENVYIRQVYESLADVAKELDVTIGIKHKKINISNSRVAWEHEQFSRVRVTALTLSELSVAPELLHNTGGLSDSRDSVDDTAIQKSIKLVAESLGRHIYGYHGRNVQIFADNSSLALNPFYVKSWLDLLSQTPRVAPFLSKNDAIVSALKKELADHTDEVNVYHETIDGMFTFYDSTRSTLSIYQVTSVGFDFVMLAIIGLYLIVLFTVLVIATRGFDELLLMIRRPPTRKSKAA